jgi:putative protease
MVGKTVEKEPKVEKKIEKAGAGDKQLVGKIVHYYTNIGVAVIDLEAPLAVGDKISIEGSTTNITQPVDSMQIEHNSVLKAKKGDSIGLKVKDRVRDGDNVYKVV